MTERRRFISDPSPALNSLVSKTQFMEALDSELLLPTSSNGLPAVLRIRINAYMAALSLFGERSAEDMLLLPSVDRLRECLRACDLLASDKPGIILALIKKLQSEDNLELICDRIVRIGKRPFQIAETQLCSGFSVGAAIVSDQPVDALSLVRNATVAMYRPLRYGEDGFELFAPEFPEKHSDPVEIESYVRHALRKNLFELAFQPQYLGDGTLYGAEALIRMQTSGGEWLEGEIFLRWVEDGELIRQIDERVLRLICIQACDWLRRNVPIPSLSVCVTAPSLLHQDFPKMVGSLLHEMNVPGRLLELELTESTTLTNLAAATRALAELASQGIRFVLCGFGLGSLPISDIQRLPIEALQVDCSSDTVLSDESGGVLRAIISRGERLGLRMTAKDIQSKTQWSALCAAGCSVLQGTLLSRPLSKSEMEIALLTPTQNFRQAV
jgi:EAL domain-containing protein (putative c-di-GMP-specific phosphodiesterase class I)/GGDEF domain-containing protein